MHNNNEVYNFERIADEWWDMNGPFKMLHRINPLRLQYIVDHIKKFYHIDNTLKVIDIGCGGGILTIPMARLGMRVTGIDPGEKNIQVAKMYAEKVGLKVEYHTAYAEELSILPQFREKYDVITIMEAVEHVEDYKNFLSHACTLLKHEGLLFISTINRTLKSFMQAILLAEHFLKLVPKHTHNWNKFLKPSEILGAVHAHCLSLVDISGYRYNIATRKWEISDDNSVNYIMCLQKK